MQSLEKRTVLAISSEVGVGAVGLSIARFAFASQKIKAICLPTIVLASRPDLGTPAGHVIPEASLAIHLDALCEDGWLAKLDGLMTGYFACVDQVVVTANFIKKLRQQNPTSLILVDPVLGDCDTGLYVPKEVAEAVRDLLLPLADIITPNLFEFSWLCDAEQPDFNDLAMQAEGLNVPHIVVTSALIDKSKNTPLPGDVDTQSNSLTMIHTVYCYQGERDVFSSRFIDQVPKGTGDVFASHLLSRLLHGDEMKAAVRQSVRFLEAIVDKAQGTHSIEPYQLY